MGISARQECEVGEPYIILTSEDNFVHSIISPTLPSFDPRIQINAYLLITATYNGRAILIKLFTQ